jgi:hypothetical protein
VPHSRVPSPFRATIKTPWSISSASLDVDWNFLVDFWAAYNRFLAHVINSLPAEAATVTCNIGNNKPATLEWIAADYVAHLKHHLNQILGQTFATGYGK